MLLGPQRQDWGDTAKSLYSLGYRWKQLPTLARKGPSTSQLSRELEERHLRMKMHL